MSREWANTLVSLSRTVAFLTLFLSGWITDRAGHKQAMVLFVSTTGLFILLIGMIHYPVMTPLVGCSSGFVRGLHVSSRFCDVVTLFLRFPSKSCRIAGDYDRLSYRRRGISTGHRVYCGKPLFFVEFFLLGLLALTMVPLLLSGSVTTEGPILDHPEHQSSMDRSFWIFCLKCLRVEWSFFSSILFSTALNGTRGRYSSALFLIQSAKTLPESLKGEFQILGLETMFRGRDRYSRGEVFQTNRGFRLVLPLSSRTRGTITSQRPPVSSGHQDR